MTNEPIPDISIPELSFAQYVCSLTKSLQERYGLVADGAVLQNDVMRMRFCQATPREPRVDLIASYHDDSLFRAYAKSSTFFLYDLLEFLKVDQKQVFPYHGSSQFQEYEKSPLQILAISIFLLNSCDLLLRGDPDQVKAFGMNFHARCVEYAKRVSGDDVSG